MTCAQVLLNVVAQDALGFFLVVACTRLGDFPFKAALSCSGHFECLRPRTSVTIVSDMSWLHILSWCMARMAGNPSSGWSIGLSWA